MSPFVTTCTDLPLSDSLLSRRAGRDFLYINNQCFNLQRATTTFIQEGKNMSKFRTCSGILLGFLMMMAAISADAQERFIDNGDGTITDTRMGLMWAQTDNQADIFWEQASGWIKRHFPDNVGTRYRDWRLPTVRELQSLYRESAGYNGYKTQCGHMVKMVPQIKISCILVWSSDSALGLPLAFNYYLGSPFTVDMTDKNGCRVLPVREIK